MQDLLHRKVVLKNNTASSDIASYDIASYDSEVCGCGVFPLHLKPSNYVQDKRTKDI